MAGCVARAWASTLTIVVDPKTGAPTSPVISAFAKTGIFPYSRALLDADIFKYSDAYKAEKDAAGAAAPGGAKRPKLTLTVEQLAEYRAELLKVEKGLDPALAARIASSSRTKMAELLTSADWLKRETEAASARQDEEKRLEDGRAAKAAAKAARGGLTKAAYEKAQKDAAAAAAAAAPPEPAAAAAPPPPPPPPPPAPAPKKAAAPRQPEGPKDNPYAAQFARARGTKRGRGAAEE